MNLNLKDKVVIVTGGGKGIGGAISLSLAREGAIVAILSRSNLDDEFKKSFEESAKDLGGKYKFFKIDLNDAQKIKPIIDEIATTYGSIYAVVNNAGVNDNKSIETTSYQDFQKSLHSNLTHYYEVTRSALPYLKASKGSILNISSKTALTGQGKTSAYAAAKGAILGLTREWAAAFARDGVRSNAIVVAESFTPLYEKWIKNFDNPQEKLKSITDKIPLEHRFTSPKEIADTAVFLISSLSSHTTGQWVFVDGGYVHLDRAL